MGKRKLEWAAYREAGRPGRSHSRVFLTYKAVVLKTLIVGDSDGHCAQRLVTGDVGTFQEDIVNPIAASAAAFGTKQDRKVINDFPIAGDRLIASDGDDPGIDGSCIIGADRELHWTPLVVRRPQHRGACGGFDNGLRDGVAQVVHCKLDGRKILGL